MVSQTTQAADQSFQDPPGKCPLIQQEQGSVFAWLHRRMKPKVEKLKHKYGHWIMLIFSHKFY